MADVLEMKPGPSAVKMPVIETIMLSLQVAGVIKRYRQFHPECDDAAVETIFKQALTYVLTGSM